MSAFAIPGDIKKMSTTGAPISIFIGSLLSTGEKGREPYSQELVLCPHEADSRSRERSKTSRIHVGPGLPCDASAPQRRFLVAKPG